MEQKYEEWKEIFIKNYVDNYINLLLDLRNKIRRAQTSEELTKLILDEQRFIDGQMNRKY